jgi:hypothetical protein
MVLKKLKKTLLRTLVTLAFFSLVVVLFWLNGILENRFGTPEPCVHPLEASILLAANESIDLNFDIKKWNLKITSGDDIIEINTSKIMPLKEGRAEILLSKKNNECTFSTKIFVVNFKASSGSGSGML